MKKNNTGIAILAVLVLVLLNAFFVAAEFALVSIRRTRVEELIREGNPTARVIKNALNAPERFIAATQLGITMASLGLGWVGEPTVAALLTPVLIPLGMPEQALHFTSFLIGFLVFSSLHIVVGEQVPKTFAIRQPVPVSQWIAYPLHVSFLLFYPLNWLLNTASRSILRLLGVREPPHQDILSDVEIEGLVEASAEHGKLVPALVHGPVSIDPLRHHQRAAFHPFRSKKPVGVIQEFYGLLLAHYAIRKVMWDAATQAQVDPDCLSFSHALAVVTEAVAEFQLTDPLDHPRLYQRLLCEVARVRLPPRKLRSNPRVVKRKMSTFEKKGPQHRAWPQPSIPFAQAFLLI